MEEFPPNSKTAKAAAREPKKIEKVASVSAKQRRKPLGKRFSETFIGGDARSAVSYVIQNVIVPSAKDLLVEAGQSAIEKFVFGDSKPRRGGVPMPNPYGHVNYNRPGGTKVMPKQTSKSARARHSFDEIVIDSKQGAEEVIDRMLDVISKYDVVTVADLYDLTGFQAAHTDQKWGWTDLRGAASTRLRGGGYLLDLPEPQPLD